jgi:hypothetical protein
LIKQGRSGAIPAVQSFWGEIGLSTLEPNMTNATCWPSQRYVARQLAKRLVFMFVAADVTGATSIAMITKWV